MAEPTEYLTHEEEQRQINDIALALGIEAPYSRFEQGHPPVMHYVLDRRKWRNWLQTIGVLAEEHGRIASTETIGQSPLDGVS